MISHISGTVDHIDKNRIIVDVSGVGYAVHAPSSYLLKAPKTGDNVKLYTYQVVREDAISLFGFPTKGERTLFSTLLSVSGIGPKAGLSIISQIPLNKLVAAIAAGNADLISTVKGVGKKTAERLIIELKEKVAKAYSIDPSKGVSGSSMQDAVSALMTLGYSATEAKKAIDGAGIDFSKAPGIEEIIRQTLSALV